MRDELNQDKRLYDLFAQLPKEAPSDKFRASMMQKIHREAIRREKRREYWGWTALILSSLFLIAVGIGGLMLLYSGSLRVQLPRISVSPFYIFIGAAALFLLVADYFVREKFRKTRKQL